MTRFSGQQLFDYGLNFIRVQLFTIPGFSSPAPLGGVTYRPGQSRSDCALCERAFAARLSNAVAAQRTL